MGNVYITADRFCLSHRVQHSVTEEKLMLLPDELMLLPADLKLLPDEVKLLPAELKLLPGTYFLRNWF